MTPQINERESLRQAIRERESARLLRIGQVKRTPEEINRLKRLIRDWLLWRWSEDHAEARQDEIAALVGITAPGLNQFIYDLKGLGLATLLAIRDFVDFSLEDMLRKPPPARPRPIPAVNEPRIRQHDERTKPPVPASSPPARSRGRRTGGGS